MSKINILIVINSLGHGGAERVVSILANRFKKDPKYNIELVLLEDKIRYELDNSIPITILSSLHYHDSTIKKTIYIPLLAFKLYRHIKKKKTDIIISFLFRADFVNILASYLHNKPIVVSERVNASSTYQNNTLNAKINKFLIKKLYPKSNHIINVSEGTKLDLIENFNIPTSIQSVIYNPYDIKKIRDLSYEKFHFSTPREKTLVAVSSLRVIKNIEMMLDAFSCLEIESYLIIVGDGSEEERLKLYTKKLNLEDRVFFVGAQSNPYKYMRHASIYISASKSEGFPNAMVEAMICGCAVVSTDCPSGPREILAPTTPINQLLQKGTEFAEYGTLVAVDDIDAMYKAIDTLLSNSAMCKQYIDKSLIRAEAFSLENIYEYYTQTLKQIIHKKEDSE